MKLNKILSSALLVVMLFAAVVGVIPMEVGAAFTGNSSATATLTEKQIETEVKKAYNYKDFNSAGEMLAYELSLGYLDSVTSKNNDYKIYVNRYTGVLYYENVVTGQILTSNPYYYDDANGEDANIELLSQIIISYSEVSTGSQPDMNSTEWAAMSAQLSTSFIKNGIRVNYTIGDTTARYLLPGRMKATKFEDEILTPMLKDFVDLMEEICNVEGYNGEYNIFTNPKYYDESLSDAQARKKNYIYLGYYNKEVIKDYLKDMYDVFNGLYKKGEISFTDRSRVFKLYNDITDLYAANDNVYTLKNPARYEPGTTLYENMIKDYYTGTEKLEIYETLEPMYVFSAKAENKDKSNRSIIFRAHAPTGYTYTEMFEDEKECGYVDNTKQKPVFRCSLEYTLNDDGTLSVRLPANSISFDETVYTLDSITILKYFGAGATTKDGYIFFPDGSGTVVDFSDFHDQESDFIQAATGKVNIYGQDYCYSQITGAHREQISMPVFGVVATENASAVTNAKYGVSEVTNGYFAIMENGASLSSLSFRTGGAAYEFGHAYCSYTPYPSDTYDLSDTISVGGAASYTIVAETKFNGSYVTKYVMLTDETIGSIEKTINPTYNYYRSDYVGMASYYRDYLYANGTLSALENVKNNLPLYIELLGSMEVIEKVLSFPVTKNVALTEFEQVLEIYNQLYDSSEVFAKEAEAYEKLAAETTDPTLKAEYEAIAKGYSEFVIDNINFRLSGFGNGGLNATYPTKLRWNRACGGKSAYRELIDSANSLRADGKNIGIYPEFDFMYISYTESFDGVSRKANASKMIDNRYASKQIYDSIIAEYVTYFSLVVNPETLEELYEKFVSKYSKYGNAAISVSTLGSDLNSNFDEDQPVNRDDAQGYISNVLETMSSDYDVMLDIGNIYTLKYASHILNVNIDSSHFRYSSYAVPFVGMVLHGSVNYAGSPINYSGNPSYDILKSIESGASLYYILCYQNAGYLKDDAILNDYYGIDYANWYESIVKSYKTVNDAIGDLQNYFIADHEIIIGERVINSNEQAANYRALMYEIIEILDSQIDAAVAKAEDELLTESTPQYGVPINVVVDRAALMACFCEYLNIDSVDTLESFDIDGVAFGTRLDAVINKYTSRYAPATGAKVVNINSIDYESKYSFITDSLATDDDYVYTDFTSDNNIVLVTYRNNEGKEVKFILNYNIYSVNVNLGNGEVYNLGKHEFVRVG